MRVIWGKPALDDLRRINTWLKREASPEFAIKTLTAIRFRAKFLEDFPRVGRPFQGNQRILRALGTSYLIRYQIRSDVVEVVRVHHEREGWQLDP